MSDAYRTIRDYFRFATTQFEKADLVFGHGTASAVDEAAFLILEALSLPIDDINPWLDARLSADERARLTALIDARVATRKPAPYLVNRAYVQGVPFYVDERVIVPRSFIGEILAEGPGFLPHPDEVRTALDLCTGSGCLAILAAFAFPNAEVHGADLSADALAVASRNIADHGLEERIVLHQGDLFEPVAGRRFDLILSNPPYVDADGMACLPPEFRAEPRLALDGGADGLALVRRILFEARRHLTAKGGLLCEIGRGRARLEAEFPDLPFFWPTTADGEGEVFWLARDDFPR
jgi:ribosomal protein L3 glutamine methyltransferase